MDEHTNFPSRRERLRHRLLPPDTDPPESCDLLILESTYGDRTRPSRKGRVEALQKVLQKALADKGIVSIPAFSLGRTQELLYELDRIGSKFPRPLREGRLKPIR